MFMNAAKKASLLFLSAAVTVSVSGCSKANPGSQMSTNQSYGRAMVRGSEYGTPETGTNMKTMSDCKSMMTKQLGKADSMYDERFINTMISHHEGAVQMAKDAEKKATHPELKQLAQNIAVTQQKEIDKLKSWRKGWYKE
jgi:uncharacterized protein (DUF305 family)